MNTALYIIQANLMLAFSGLIYFLILRNRVPFKIARLWVVSFMVIAALAPLAGNLLPDQTNTVLPTITLQPVSISPTATDNAGSGFNLSGFLTTLFFILSGAALIRFATGLLRIGRYTSKHKCFRAGQFRYYFLPENEQAFSFFNMIFIPQNQMFTAISLHEEQHARLYHSADLVLSGIFSILFWINPLYWLLSKELRSIHEFQADRAVIDKGTDMVQYQQILLSAAVGHYPGLPVSQLRPSFIKTRIIMMKQTKKFRKSAVRLIPALMLAVGALWFTACGSKSGSDEKSGKDSASTEVADPQNQTSTETASGEVFETAEVMPEYPGGNEAMSAFMVKNIKYPETAKTKGIQGTVYVSFEVSSSGKVTNVKVQESVSPDLDAEAVRVVKMMPDWKPAENKGKPVAVSMTLPVKFKLQ
ncbi:MAG TPA: M56 family metallopeptidase [Bacteroidales bacterium]|nr:M56 family metallopeptidase [Bacteroidales bacterium]